MTRQVASTRARRAAALLGLVGATTGCGETSQELVAFPMSVAGASAARATLGEWTVDVHDARVGLGPIYFCASAFADADLCGNASAEVTESVTVDTLDPTPVEAATVVGLTGTHRVAIYDYGRSWFLRYDGEAGRGPVPTEGAPDGHSLVLDATATRSDGATLELVVRIDADPSRVDRTYVAGQPAVHTLTTRTSKLQVTLDATAWLTPLTPPALAGDVDLDDLAALGEARVEIVPGLDAGDPRAAAYAAIRFAMQRPALLPTFEWSEGMDPTAERGR